jgi:CRP-like cAMP-binding protein
VKPLDTRAFLTNLPLFRELEPQEIERVAQSTQQVRVLRGETLFKRGDPCTGIHALVYGQVKLSFISSQGDEKVVDIIGPGETFGEALMFMDKPYIVSAQALADSLLLHVSKAAIFEELERHPAFARRMLAGLSWRLHKLVRDVEAYSLRSGTQRVIGYLLRDEQAQPVAGPFQVTLPASKGIIASRLNLTPEHFSRILHDLAAAGLIEVEGRTITIKEVEKLRAYDR